MRAGFRGSIPLFVLALSVCLAALAQGPGQQEQPAFVKQGQELMRAGKLEDALALYRQTLQTSPDSLPANVAAGSVLDLMGRSKEARTYFQKAIDKADTPERKAMAERSMAMSYAFEGNCAKTLEHESRVLEYYRSTNNFYQQGEILDEGARVCIDASDDLHPSKAKEDLADAQKWYQAGRDAGLKEPDIKSARVDLWNFRWEHAQARLAARRGDKAEALKHVSAAQAIVEKGSIPEQKPFLPYLEGYVAFYAGNYGLAGEELLQANQNDPFIQCMMARTYGKLGKKDKAIEYYRKAAGGVAHNPPAAYAVPYAKGKLAKMKGAS
ncbi:MAG TPA: tetratricopeptide repeat protein [Candidatus Acidoferrum sp.]|nr:tetratricopeptide repeat protein [Candidatus Acidoferrum sp.]